MKTSVGSLALIGAALIAGSTMAQTAPRQNPGSGPETGAAPDRAEAVISTTRSNIKRPGLVLPETGDTGPETEAGSAGADAPEAVISTTRSNITRPDDAPSISAGAGPGAASLADAGPDAGAGGGDGPDAPEAAISTSRSNIKRPDNAPLIGAGPETGATPDRAGTPVVTRPPRS